MSFRQRDIDYFARIREREASSESAVSDARDVLWKDIRIIRAGTIPYCFRDGDLTFLLAVDRRYGNATDFGGSVEGRESPLDAAVRETVEESGGLLQPTKSQLLNGVAAYTPYTVVYFWHMCDQDVASLFKGSDEISQIVPMTIGELRYALVKGQIYERVANTLRGNLKDLLLLLYQAE